MRQHSVVAAMTILAISSVLASAQDKQPAGKADPVAKPVEPALDTYEQKRSYLMGLQYGMAVRRDGIPVDIRALLMGVHNAFSGRRALSDQEMLDTEKKYAEERKQRAEQMRAKFKKLEEDNLVAGKAFMAGNKDAEGVITTDSGLQYKVLKKGEGAFPKPTDTVQIRYRGWYIGGREFSNTGERIDKLKLDAPGTIRGWVEAMGRMQVGCEYRLFIPSDLVVDSKGKPIRGLQPGATVIFDIELVGIAEDDPADKPDEPASKK